MPRYVPEIRISAAEYAAMENESHSECAMSDVATDCETLEGGAAKKPQLVLKAPKQDDVLLTDVDGSSDDEEERETVLRYPADCINSILDLGMSCEETCNSQGPNKRQKSITCSLERSKGRSLNLSMLEDGGTDVEGINMSEDEDGYRIDSDFDANDYEPHAFVSISDKVVTGAIISPRQTPDLNAGKKKKSQSLRTPVPISSVLTDTEMLISDAESYRSSRSRKLRNKTSKKIFTSDTDDSDSSIDRSMKFVNEPNKKIIHSRSFDTIKQISNKKNCMLAPINKKPSTEALTDTENIYLDDGMMKVVDKRHQNRPSVICNSQISGRTSPVGLRQRQNVTKSKQPNMTQKHSNFNETSRIRSPNHSGKFLNMPLKDDSHATDIETFGSDSDDQVEEVQPIAYLPNSKCELVIANENHRGRLSIILPISESQKNKTLMVENLDCGFSDVEDLSGCEAEDYVRYPTPDLPRMEASTVENREKVVERNGLFVETLINEPLTDVEELEVGHKSVGNVLKVKVAKKGKDIKECHTDVEDLDESDHESSNAKNYNRKNIIPNKLLLNDDHEVQLTDVGDFSSDDSDEGIYRFTAVTPDMVVNNSYTMARESMSPFSFDVKRQMNDSIPKIRMISPSPIPRNTDVEDIIASREASFDSNCASDDGNIEPYCSVVHINQSRKFNVDNFEKDHIKGFVQHPDPVTDVEELTMLEALEELKRRRKRQKNKEQEGTVRVCYSGAKGASCKWSARNSMKHEREEESHESVSKITDTKGKGPKDTPRK